MDTNRSYGDLYNRFQKKLMKFNLIIICVIFAIESLFYIISLFENKTAATINVTYILLNIILPAATNIIICGIGNYIIKCNKNHLLIEIYDAIPLYILELIIVNILIIHYTQPVLYALIIFPIFISIIYGNYKVNHQLFLISQFEIIALTLSSILTNKNLPNNYLYCIFIIEIIIIFAYIYSKFIISYEKEKEIKVITLESTNAFLNKEISIDGLTQLNNYKALEKTAQKWISNKKKVIFCIIDIDNFKKVNDTYGHEFGNLVLINLAKDLKNISSENIFVARYGGEEFGILFNGYEYKDAYNVIDSVRIDFNDHIYDETLDKFTFSGGITELNKNDTVHKLFNTADKNLYKAKRTGKNKIM